MPTTIIAGNWKMNTDLAGALELAAAVGAGAGSLPGVELILCPPFVSIAAAGIPKSPIDANWTRNRRTDSRTMERACATFA